MTRDTWVYVKEVFLQHLLLLIVMLVTVYVFLHMIYYCHIERIIIYILEKSSYM